MYVHHRQRMLFFGKSTRLGEHAVTAFGEHGEHAYFQVSVRSAVRRRRSGKCNDESAV
jgi:hypothetical protein